MIGQHFYHKSIKKLISTFGSLLSDITVETGQKTIMKVPLHFSQKQKFIEAALNNTDVRNMYTDITLPALGFEITNYLYTPERMTNPLNTQHIKVNSQNIDFMFTSVPYTVGIELYLMTNTLDEAYQVLEQIVPFFTPQLTVTITDIDLHNLKTNITFDLTAISQDVQYESSFDEKRTIMFNFSFSAHTMFHSNPRKIDKIKKILIDMKESDHEKSFSKLVGNLNADGEIEWSDTHGQD